MGKEGTTSTTQSATKPPSSLGWIVTTAIALIVFRTLGVVGGLTTFGLYYWLQPRIGTVFALVISAVLGISVGIGVAVAITSSNSALSTPPSSASRAPPAPQMPRQQVGDLRINYSFPFTENAAEAQHMMSGLSTDTSVKLAVYNSPPTCGLGEVRLVVATYTPGLQASVDDAASGAIARVSSLEGIVQPKATTAPMEVSGLPARLTSFSAERWGGVIGAEFLAILDEESNTLWQLQFIFANQAATEQSSFQKTRLCAKKIASTVTIEHTL